MKDLQIESHLFNEKQYRQQVDKKIRQQQYIEVLKN